MARLCAVLALVASLVSALAPGARVAAQQAPEALDLPAIVFTAADLAEFGFEGYGVDSASPYDMAADATYISDLQQLDLDEVEAVFTEAGHQGSYFMLYKLPADPDDPSGLPLRELQTAAYLFADADAAEAAYEVIADESNSGGADIDNAGLNIGDESEMTTLTSQSDVNYGIPDTQIELEIRFDRLVLEVSTFNYDPETAGMPIFEADELEIVEAMGERLVERAQAALDDDSPNLSLLTPRLESDVYDAFQIYDLIDGDGIRLVGQSDDDFESSVEGRLDGGTESLLRTEQILVPATEDASEIRYYSPVIAFERERDAIAYVDGLVDRFSANERYTNVDGEEVPGLGDQAFAATLEYDDDAGDTVELIELFVRVGKTVAASWVDQPGHLADVEMLSLDSLIELGEAQVECIENGGCDGPLAVPDELAELIGGSGAGADEADDAAADDEADTDEEPAGDETAGEVYESPQYGYTLTYDSAVWSISSEDDVPDDAYDRVTLETDEGFVGIIGDPDYRPSQLDDCVADYQAGLEQGDDVDNVRAMRGEDGEEDGRAWAAFTYDLLGEDDEEPLEVARYIECQAHDDVTIVILQTSLESDYDDLSDARVALLDGLE
jgi:hypothetical protein